MVNHGYHVYGNWKNGIDDIKNSKKIYIVMSKSWTKLLNVHSISYHCYWPDLQFDWRIKYDIISHEILQKTTQNNNE